MKTLTLKDLSRALVISTCGFRFTARFYGPHTALIDGSYNMPGVVRMD